MKINSRGLNKGERFCCNQSEVKSVFHGCEISIRFAAFARNFKPKSINSQISGKIISTLIVPNVFGQIGADGSRGEAYLNFYVLREGDFSEKLQKEFTSKILPIMYSEYIRHKDGNPGGISGVYYFYVELLNEKLVVHERIEN